jgi:hypothetical protein
MIHRSTDLTVVASSERYPGSWVGDSVGAPVSGGLLIEGTITQVDDVLLPPLPLPLLDGGIVAYDSMG